MKKLAAAGILSLLVLSAAGTALAHHYDYDYRCDGDRCYPVRQQREDRYRGHHRDAHHDYRGSYSSRSF